MIRVFKTLSTILFISINFYNAIPTDAKENHLNLPFQNNLEINNDENLTKNEYLLGPGDELMISLEAHPSEKYQLSILNNGTLIVPYLGPVNINNLSQKDAEKKIENELSKELIAPAIKLQLLKAREISIILIGEVNTPGIYSSKQIKETTATNTTLFDVITEAGGLSPEANIENIILRRRISGTNKTKEREVNLIKLLKEGDFEQNPYLFDGDIIKINRVDSTLKKKEFNKIANTNIASKININIIGQINKPGRYSINANTPLNKAIYIAGGPKSWKAKKGYVKIVRINDDSSLSTYKVKANLNKSSNKQSNPLLKSGDTIFVEKNLFANTTGVLKAITSPIADALIIRRFYNIISD